ncbi:DUF5684 domain-containing protein [Microbacterium sp. ZW T5_45]|uniref:DUF5684 domain-containing protein n=1 Tax=Microbacterium sp. ZW T5_45 TaxID=3378080 RepID=UPI003852B08B
MNEVADQVHLAVDYGSSSGVLAAFGIVYGVAAVLGLLVYVWYALALSKLFPRLGAEGWKGWVPILNEATILQLGGKPAWNVVFYFIPIVQIYGLILKIQATHKINERYGRGAGSTVLAVLLPPVWASILAWGVAPYPEGDRLAALQPGPRRQAPPADAEHHGAGQGYLAPPILPHAGAGAGAGASAPFAPAAPFAPSAPFDSAAPGAGAPAQAAPTHGDPLFGTPMFTAPASDPGVPASPADDLFANPAAPPAPAYAPVAPPTFAPLLPDPPGGFVPAPPAAPEAPAASESSSGGAAPGFGSAAPAPESWVPASADGAAPVSPVPATWDPPAPAPAPSPASWDSGAPAPAAPTPGSWDSPSPAAPADAGVAPASWRPAAPTAPASVPATSPSWDSAPPVASGSGSPAAPAQPTWTPEPLPGPGKEESVLWTPGPVEPVQTGTIVVPDAGHGAPSGVPPVPLPPVFAAAPPAFAPAPQDPSVQDAAPHSRVADARDAGPSWPLAAQGSASGDGLIVDVPGAARTASIPTAGGQGVAPETPAAHAAAEADRAFVPERTASAPAVQDPSADEPALHTLRRAPIRVSLEPETASTDAADTLAGAGSSPAQPAVDVEHRGREAAPAAPQPASAFDGATDQASSAGGLPQRGSAPETAPTPIWDQFVGRAYEAAVAESVAHAPHDEDGQTLGSAPQSVAAEPVTTEQVAAPALPFEWPTPPPVAETPVTETPAAETPVTETPVVETSAPAFAAEVPVETLAPAPVLEPPLRGPDLGSRGDLSAGIRPAPIPVTLPEPPVAEPEPEAADDDFEATVVVPRRRGVRRVLVLDDGRSFALSASSVVIGRNPAGEAGEQRLAISDGTRTLSKTHARLIVQGDEWRLTDLHSTNGVVVVADDGAETLLDPGESVIGAGRFILGEVGMHVEVESDS